MVGPELLRTSETLLLLYNFAYLIKTGITTKPRTGKLIELRGKRNMKITKS